MSAEVQKGIFSNVHALTQGCGEALHRMLAFEKEHAVMRTKCTDDAAAHHYQQTTAAYTLLLNCLRLWRG